MENTKEKEIWKCIPGYKNYQASNMGRVRSVDRWVTYSDGRKRFFKGRILDGYINNGGYRQITLSVNSKIKTLKVSQIIAKTFLGHSVNGNKLVVDHINGDKLNDRLSNLRIVTHRQNISDVCFRKDREMLSSKYVGVSWSKHTKKWRAQILFEDKIIHLGYHSTEIDASNAYQKALAKVKNNTFNPLDYKPNFASKFKGVAFNKKNNKWVSQIWVSGKLKYLGSFSTEIEASEAYQKFKKDNNIDK